FFPAHAPISSDEKRNKFEVIELDSDDDDGGDEIATCRCCQRVAHRSQMVKMPRRAVEWREWMNALQVPYDIDHEKRKTHYLCKHHFPENSFTKQGRLRKGVLPLEFEEESE
uniref:THAP-type domain-containing protein n=1 Tax=Caenorhabditis japonica TaxID=281687 RepID=A0A8R1EG92_CAEJA